MFDHYQLLVTSAYHRSFFRWILSAFLRILLVGSIWPLCVALYAPLDIFSVPIFFFSPRFVSFVLRSFFSLHRINSLFPFTYFMVVLFCLISCLFAVVVDVVVFFAFIFLCRLSLTGSTSRYTANSHSSALSAYNTYATIIYYHIGIWSDQFAYA